MKLFLHVCCGPCTIYPLSILRGKGVDVTGYFYNPNIHPFKEFKRRLSSLEIFSENSKMPLVVDKGYGLTNFVRKVAFHEAERCNICYLWRLENTASLAKEQGFEAFSTTLLYSKYQNHNLLISHCEELSAKYDIPFIYEDFRVGWQYGIDKSKELELYRQPYCGCIYSEQERYDKSLRKK
jgi:predicted adenine nucleotide alpha hydrolase (AANH) superfamily ATPase